MPVDADIKKAYKEANTARKWARERTTARWQLAAASVTNKLPLNGPAVLKHPCKPDSIGKRKLQKAQNDLTVI